MSDSDFRSSEMAITSNLPLTFKQINPTQVRTATTSAAIDLPKWHIVCTKMMRTTRALFFLLCFLRGTSAFVPSTPPPRTPALSLWPMTKMTDKTCANGKERSWRRQLVSIVPSMLRPTENKKKRRALASLLVAASFALSKPVAAFSSKDDVASCVVQRESSDGNIRQEEEQQKSTRLNGDPKLASIPVSSENQGFWTKRKVVMIAAGGGTVLGLSLVPPVKDEDDDTDDRPNPSSRETKVQPLPSSVTKEAFRELEELFGGGGENAKSLEAFVPEPFVKSSVPSIEEDVRVISDPSAEKAIAETSAKPKSKGIKAVKKVTPVIEEEVFNTNVPPSNTITQESKVETIAENKDRAIGPESNQDVAATAPKKDEATRKAILEETVQTKQKAPNETDKLIGDTVPEESNNGVSDDSAFLEKGNSGNSDNEETQNAAEVAPALKKEEATRRAILEERLKEEAKKLEEEIRLRKAKDDEAARRALLEERLKQESIAAEAKKDEQRNTEKSDNVETAPTTSEILQEGLSSSLNVEESPSDEPLAEVSSEFVEPITERKLEYRRQPLSPEEEAELQKKYSSLPLKERAYRILVDLGMIDSSPE